jgi:type I restriction enzyme M protein
LDELHTLREKKANRLNQPIEDPIFSTDQEHLRWSRFINTDPKEMYKLIDEGIFPFMKNLGDDDSAFATHVKPPCSKLRGNALY